MRNLIDPAALREQADRCDCLRAGYKLAGDTSYHVNLIHLALHLRQAAKFTEQYTKDLNDARRNIAPTG